MNQSELKYKVWRDSYQYLDGLYGGDVDKFDLRFPSYYGNLKDQEFFILASQTIVEEK